jgi:formylglycine-generating enzyme required for sulfatase activity
VLCFLSLLHAHSTIAEDTDTQRPAEAVTNSIGMKLVLIPAGEFLMGSPDTEDGRENDEHQHRVRITKPFYMGVYEVTQREYERVMGGNHSAFSRNSLLKAEVQQFDTDQFPVESISWTDAIAFLQKLSELPEEKTAGRHYRLPTEAEWEYACRAGTQSVFHFGNQSNGSDANVPSGHPYGTSVAGPELGRTTTVGSYKPNGFGVHDMHGNVFEWCQDWYGKDYYRVSPVGDPQGPSRGSQHVIRGGAWESDPVSSRSASRYHFPEKTRDFLQRARPARDIAIGLRAAMSQ